MKYGNYRSSYASWPLPPELHLSISATGPASIGREEILYFGTYIQNNRENSVEGDYWLSVLLPNSNEILVPGGFLNYPNPLLGQVFGCNLVGLSNQLFVPALADTGSYSLIGRIGIYPKTVVDEESFEFQVVE